MDFPKQPNLYTYNRQHQRLHFDDHPFYFFGSGSSGNSVYLKKSHLLIDLGFPFKKYVDVNPMFFYDVHYILLTHEHSDHLNESTLMHILEVYPNVHFLISQRMFTRITGPLFYNRFNSNRARAERQQNELKNKYFSRFTILKSDENGNGQTLELYENDPYLNLPTVTVKPHFVSHADIINVAYELITNEHHILYSSDLDHVFAPKPTTASNDQERIDDSLSLPLEYDQSGHVKIFTNPFDLIFLEANYDADYLHHYLEMHPDDAHARGNLRHISEQETWKYIQYALSQNGVFVPLHASTAFGTLIQDLSEEDLHKKFNQQLETGTVNGHNANPDIDAQFKIEQ